MPDPSCLAPESHPPPRTPTPSSCLSGNSEPAAGRSHGSAGVAPVLAISTRAAGHHHWPEPSTCERRSTKPSLECCASPRCRSADRGGENPARMARQRGLASRVRCTPRRSVLGAHMLSGAVTEGPFAMSGAVKWGKLPGGVASETGKVIGPLTGGAAAKRIRVASRWPSESDRSGTPFWLGRSTVRRRSPGKRRPTMTAASCRRPGVRGGFDFE